MEARWGKCLGRYELVAELGRGAMGVVYKARDPKIDRFVAVKTISLLHVDNSEAQSYRERFFHEAQAVGRLVHPGIVTVFDVGEDPETRTPYIVMEYVDGKSLDRFLGEKGGKLSIDTALQLVEQLAEALDCAHGQGIVHRDIKPANILITKAGHPKITDFGIAKLNVSHLTLPGQVLGSPAYMSPEQLNDEPFDGRSDLFSLGVILYNMVSGHRPFQGNSVTTVCFKVTNRDPLPPSAFDPGLPAGLDAIVSRAMAKEPGERYQRGLEFALDARELRDRLLADPQERLLPRKPTAGNSEAGRLPSFLSHRRILEGTANWAGYCQKSLRRFMEVFAQHPSACIFAVAILTVALGAATWYRGTYWPPPKPPSFTAIQPSPPANVPDIALKPQSAARLPQQLSGHAAVPFAKLLIGIAYPFADADISIACDDKLIYSHSLKGERKKRLGLFSRVEGEASDAVRLEVGPHRLRVHVRSPEDNYDQFGIVSAAFSQKQQRTLQVSFHGREKEMRLDLH
ncbi:MAG TPA: serine/threonine-protein kinase [Terriglobales bacterium]|nr:serine/threonine-protein kinase [Terriglobales bacterium]